MQSIVIFACALAAASAGIIGQPGLIAAPIPSAPLAIQAPLWGRSIIASHAPVAVSAPVVRTIVSAAPAWSAPVLTRSVIAAPAPLAIGVTKSIIATPAISAPYW
ncbi:hypothetical protein WA026_009554 [Henosepilachna vigintioctopunctata]|uniref:Uncharacterized protein n=1 Tax=Henosepilachna vigintioctopunctata TaxID=420089 RepID=A0AAW1TW03_9CUCU